ncbi:helix-turn-helix domain-containing protein [Curtobacterium flaccumfaciens]|uniref:helix-turn-helix domain-containing protein n=1 Tax=Curtobacterium flaccumfaciens TaxID=2035 RepID=UPI00188DBAAA|nr:helix-turn-helix domain-containing protein [Curtobacterium flaccumfaciens]MBF4595209.1 helix-turn-helix domain-containing protein [Curtobacterium flaccumfaciens]
MTKLLTIEEAAPLVRKTEGAMRWWLRQKGCPIKTAKIGGRLFIREEDITAHIEAQFAEAS